MGEVYHAVDSNLARPVALKILTEQFIRSEESVQRFIQEARAASALNHPNIVTVYDIGKVEVVTEDDARRLIHFIAMELIEGETLRALIKREDVGLRQRVDVLSQVAAGLAKAHAAGIIHRDLKPDNVMMTSDGYAKVLDFGLAKLTEKDRPHDGSTSRQLTQVGTVLGTIGYMSPEQVEHRAIDHRSDIFSFGCVAYQALSGKSPFERGSLIDTLYAIVHEPAPKLADIVPDAPAPLVEIIERCLEKDPEKRPQSMREIANGLQDIARATDPNSLVILPPAKRRAITPTVVAIVAAVLIPCALLVGFALRNRQPTPFDEMKITRVASNGRSTVAAISPDGKYLSYSVEENGKQSLWIRQVASGSDIQIVPMADVHFVGATFSPDANFLYYVSADNPTDKAAIYQVPVIGGPSKMLIDDLHARIAVSPDGQRFVYSRTDRANARSVIATRAIGGGAEQVVAERKLPDTFTAASWSPDGESIGFSYVTYGGGYHAVVGYLELDDRREKVITSPQWRIVDSLLWVPEGDALVINAKDASDTRNQIWMLRRDGRARRITNDLSDYEAVSLTADGTKLVTLQKNQSSSIWIAPGGSAPQARQLVRATGNLDGLNGLVCMEGGIVVYSSASNDARDLWAVDRDGGAPRRLTDGGSDILPSASSDGRSVAFMSMRNGRSNIWRLDVPTNGVSALTRGDFESSPSVSPDGSWVAYHSNQSGVRTIWRINAAGGEPVQVTKTASSWPSVSPDGKWIACSWFDTATGRIGIAVVPAEGGEPSKFFAIPVNAWMGGNNHHVRWLNDGLAYVANSNGVSNIFLQPLDGSAPRQLTRFSDGHIFYFDWMPDGRDLVVSRGSVTSNVVMIDGFR
jgi:serine/threonine protein kinase